MLPVPRWTIFVHAAQMLLAIVILGFDAYGISFIGYYALIFSLIVVRHFSQVPIQFSVLTSPVPSDALYLRLYHWDLALRPEDL
jgi:hypothetical protein